MLKKIRIATRTSPLAMWQAEEVSRQLQALYPHLEIELLGMKTKGDKILDTPLAKIGGKGLFVKELEIAMLENKADIAVHSLKDVPMAFPEGLHLPIIMKRHDPRDAFVSNHYEKLADLPSNACIGTSSLRRQAQLMAKHPNFKIKSLRGNVNTRLSKLDNNEFDAIILASSGLKRLGFSQRIKENIDPKDSLPAIGQGALGIECRNNDQAITTLLTPLHDKDTYCCISAERSLNQRLNGGCQVPIAGFAQLEGDILTLRALVAKPDGSMTYYAKHSMPRSDAETLGLIVAEDLLSQGAGNVLKSLGINVQ